MSKRKPIDKAQARERRNQLLASAAAAKLSLTDGVREMRAISGMTQEEFARHREVSARVIKAIELGQGNPTVATLNRIGGFFGLEVGFVPINRSPAPSDKHMDEALANLTSEHMRLLAQQMLDSGFAEALAKALRHSDTPHGTQGEHSLEQSANAKPTHTSAGKGQKPRAP